MTDLVICKNIERSIVSVEILHQCHKLLAEATLGLVRMPLHEEHALAGVDQPLQLGVEVLLGQGGGGRQVRSGVAGVGLHLLGHLGCVDTVHPDQDRDDESEDC